MPFVRHYVMTAREGEAPALLLALQQLARRVAPLEGCEGCDLYRDSEQPERFHFLEHWQSPERHREGGKALGKEAFAPIMAVLAKPPESASLTPIETA